MTIKYYGPNGEMVWAGSAEDLTVEILNIATENGWDRVLEDD